MDPEYGVRLAGDADVDALARMRASWTFEFKGEDLAAIEASEYAAFAAGFRTWWEIEKHQRRTWIGERVAEPVGMLNMLTFTRMPSPGRPVSRWGYIANVFVAPPHRGAGLGRRLIDAALDHARDNGFARVLLSPSPKSIDLYARAGFVPADALRIWTPEG